MAGKRGSGTVEVASGLYCIVRGPDNPGTTNLGVVVTPEGAVAIDTGMGAGDARDIMDVVRRVTDQPLKYVVNTHYHGDHVYGNQFLSPVAILGHVECRKQMLELWGPMAEYFIKGDPSIVDDVRRLAPTPPQLTFETGLTLQLGDVTLDLRYLGRAHTRGDIVVHLPRERVVFVGDLVDTDITPVSAEGFVESWVQVLGNVRKLPFEAVVPGHGLVGDASHVQSTERYLGQMLREVTDLFKQGVPVDEVVRRVTLREFAHWPEAERTAPGVRRLYTLLARAR